MNYYDKEYLNIDMFTDNNLKAIILAFIEKKVPDLVTKSLDDKAFDNTPSFCKGEGGLIRYINMSFKIANELMNRSEYNKANNDLVYLCILLNALIKNNIIADGQDFVEFAKYYIHQCGIHSTIGATKIIDEVKNANKLETSIADMSLFVATCCFFDKYYSTNSKNLERAFRIQKRNYLIEDAKNQCECLFSSEIFSDGDYETIVDIFENKADCNIADNDTWYTAIKIFLHKRNNKELNLTNN